MSWSESNAISKGKIGVKLLEKFGREIKKNVIFSNIIYL